MSTIYGDIIMYARFKNKHSWDIQIDKLTRNQGDKPKQIMIGIIDTLGLENSITKINNPGLYAYDNLGAVYKKGKCIETKKDETFVEGDVIHLSFDTRVGILKGSTKNKYNEIVCKWPRISGIEINCNYRLLISIHGTKDAVTILQNQCDST
eukprot:404559_1